MKDGRPPKVRNFIAKALRIHRQQIIAAKKGRGSYRRGGKHKGDAE